MYRMGKKLRRLTLGRFPTLGLAAAREKATDALRDAAKDQDPGRRKIEERRAETFAELAREYIERHASKKRSGREDVRLLDGSPHKKKTGKKPHVPLVTRWGDRRIKDIKRRDIRELLTRSSPARPSWRTAPWRSCARCSTSRLSASGWSESVPHGQAAW
jgi:Arm DNA-binding domain